MSANGTSKRRSRWAVAAGLGALLASSLYNSTSPVGAVPTGGGKIVCEGTPGGDAEVFVMNADGSDLRYLTDNTVRDGDPAWSTNGRIAFESSRDGSSEVWVMNADGTGATQLTFTQGSENRGASWSPDNRQLTFHSTRDGTSPLSPHGNFEIYRMNADGSGQTRLTDSLFMEAQPDWSPVGNRILYNSNRDVDVDVYSMNSDGSDQRRVALSPLEDSGPTWSPDGSKIAFQSRRTNDLEIYRMNADGTGVVRLTTRPGFDAFVDWSPDGTRLVFTSDRHGDFEVYTMSAVDGSDVRRLTTIPGFDGRCSWRGSPSQPK
ncbi:MAG: DUF5050 domain-containing protein [Actinomycetota bacterium]|nr:DUF5050 domain-containing protein [Actinomycetota bacterium]